MTRSLRTLGALFVAPVLAALLLSWWLIGDVSEPGGYLQILPLPSSATVAAVAGVFGILIAVVPVRELRAIHRTPRVGPVITRLVVSGVALGLFTGFVLRVLSSKTDGANIGGGMLMMVGPFIALASWSTPTGAGGPSEGRDPLRREQGLRLSPPAGPSGPVPRW